MEEGEAEVVKVSGERIHRFADDGAQSAYAVFMTCRALVAALGYRPRGPGRLAVC